MLAAASPWQSAQERLALPSLVPQGLAVEHRQHRRIGGVVVLHRLGFAAHVSIGRATRRRCDLGGEGGKEPKEKQQRRGPRCRYGGHFEQLLVLSPAAIPC